MIVNNSPTNVVVIGGGITGLGIARDAAMRGFKVSVFERSQIGSGTSGYFHCMLHSGARYAVADPLAARDCYTESKTLLRIARGAVYPTGGLFLGFSDEEAQHGDTLLDACQSVGIGTKEVSVDRVLKEEPNISRSLRRAFAVEDGYIDGPKLLELNRVAAQSAANPAKTYTHHIITAINLKNGRVRSVTARDLIANQSREVPCDFLINAAGVWAGRVAEMTGISLPITPDKGSMIVFDRSYTKVLINRIRVRPGNGDIVVNALTHSILGTTSRPSQDLDEHSVTEEEVEELLQEGRVMVPSMSRSHMAYAYAGVRPLYSADHYAPGREASRSYQVINHLEDGINNFISVVGGKFTIYRLMAEKAVDQMCQQLGDNAKSRTSVTPFS